MFSVRRGLFHLSCSFTVLLVILLIFGTVVSMISTVRARGIDDFTSYSSTTLSSCSSSDQNTTMDDKRAVPSGANPLHNRCKWNFVQETEQQPLINTEMNNSSEDIPDAIAEIGSYRDALPTHFTFKIKSFSKFTTTSMKKYESNDFEAGGYKWKLVFHPNGNNTASTIQKGSSENHVSMYLKIVDTNSLPRGWVLDVSFRFFVLDQIRDKYLILGDMGGRTRRFHEMKTTSGYNQLLPLTTLNDSSNGYLVDDTCVFGAEVLPCKSTGCGDCLTMVKSPSCVKYTWKIENFSKKKEQQVSSDVFNAEEHKWEIQIYPKGDSRANNENLSLFLWLVGPDIELATQQVYVRYKLRVRDQLHNLHSEQIEVTRWFTSLNGRGSSRFMRLDELNVESKGYLVNDTCIVEAEVTVLGAAKKLP